MLLGAWVRFRETELVTGKVAQLLQVCSSERTAKHKPEKKETTITVQTEAKTRKKKTKKY